MKFICLGYIDHTWFASTPEAEVHAMMDRCFAYDDELRANGHVAGGEALEPPGAAKTLRRAGGRIVVTDGPFAETKEQLGGILILEARDMEQAVELISKHPGAGMGPWEIRPAADLDEWMRQSEARRGRPGATTFHTSREIPAAAEEVFAAIRDPDRLARWWGPEGFTNTFSVCEFKPGGRWSLVMHGPNGADYPGEYRFVEIDTPRKVVVQHVTEPRFRLTISLAPAASGKGTRVGWAQAFEDAEVARKMEKIVAPANRQNLERLAAAVISPLPGP